MSRAARSHSKRHNSDSARWATAAGAGGKRHPVTRARLRPVRTCCTTANTRTHQHSDTSDRGPAPWPSRLPRRRGARGGSATAPDYSAAWPCRQRTRAANQAMQHTKATVAGRRWALGTHPSCSRACAIHSPQQVRPRWQPSRRQRQRRSVSRCSTCPRARWRSKTRAPGHGAAAGSAMRARAEAARRWHSGGSGHYHHGCRSLRQRPNQ